MLQWLFTLLGAVNKTAEAVLSVAEAIDASAQTLKSAALDSIECDETKRKLIEADEFNRYSLKTKSTLKSLQEFRQLKQSKEEAKQQ
ncbi:MAG: hypothetical protein ACMV1B_01225 [Prevotella sp.]